MQGVRGWLCVCVLGRDGSLLPLTVADFSPCRAFYCCDSLTRSRLFVPVLGLNAWLKCLT
jgi:hypothetical protein